jgi:DNA polymerase-3 subunit gamma/tau
VGQSAAIDLLRLSFSRGRLGHAYLFSGPRGCGKTTAARILAKAVNCESPSPEGEPCRACDSCRAVTSGEHMDVMEIDGASNRGIDQIRELKSHVGLTSFMGGMKVYILDEVHMLTAEAFNALLKTLEEPPPSVMFIFATTEPHKVPVTIRSRCQHIPFHRIPTEVMVEQLKSIAEAEKLKTEDSALWEIARSADGALRDAISLFEQAIALGQGELSSVSVQGLFGGGSRAEMERWVVRLRDQPDEASAALKSMLDLGVSPERFLDGLFPLLRDMWVFSLWGEKSFDGTSLSPEEKDFLRSEVPNWNSSGLKRAASACAGLFSRARFGLRNDVFSGLLLFEMLSVFENEATVQSKPVKEETARSVSERAVSVTPEIPFTSVPVLSECLPEAVAAVAKDDLPLAAALIDVKVFRSEGALRLDFSTASEAARVMLTQPRAGAVLERAFGVEPVTAGGVHDGGEDVSREVSYVSAGKAPSSAEVISARIGADILMSRRLSADDNDTGDIEDEQL